MCMIYNTTPILTNRLKIKDEINSNYSFVKPSIILTDQIASVTGSLHSDPNNSQMYCNSNFFEMRSY